MKNGIFQTRIVSTGVYLPQGKLTASDAHKKSSHALNKKIDLKYFDVASRPVSVDENISDMGAKALKEALESAKLEPRDLDLIIFGSSMPEQPIPTTSVLVHKKLGLGLSGIPCFDVNSTCTSFLTAFEVASNFLACGSYKKIAIVTSEVGSKGINWKEVEVASLIADGAAAVIVEKDPTATSQVLCTSTQTFSEGSELCEIRAGGSKWNIVTPPPEDDDYLFRMHGRGIYKVASKYIPNFVENLFAKGNIKHPDIDWIVPHQASPLAIQTLTKKLGFAEDRLINIIQTHGNQVASSLPTALNHCLKHKAKRGHKILMLGTGAGLTISGTVFVY